MRTDIQYIKTNMRLPSAQLDGNSRGVYKLVGDTVNDFKANHNHDLDVLTFTL